jgi:5-carboxymethyl-2-hydroxymuconate isomerase
MPYLHLHLSPALCEHDWQPFFQEAHEFLSAYTKIQNCKSSVKRNEQSWIGEGDPQHAVCFLEILLLPRPEDVMTLIGETLHTLLKRHAEPVLQQNNLVGTPSVELRVLTHYWY